MDIVSPFSAGLYHADAALENGRLWADEVALLRARLFATGEPAARIKDAQEEWRECDDGASPCGWLKVR